VSAFVALAGFTVFGATEPFQLLKVHIPEAVHVAQSELPAGDYTVRFVDVGGDVPVLAISSEHGAAILVTAMRNDLPNNTAAERSELTFDKIDGTLTLSRIKVEGLKYSYEIHVPHQHGAPITH